MAILYTQEARISPEQLTELFDSSGIVRPTGDISRLGRMIEGADLIVTAWDGQRLIGVARALTDFSYCCYLSDLAIAKEYQKRGVGTELIRRVQTSIGDECTLLLVSTPAAMPFYSRIGLEPVANGWCIKRKR